jgi:hypothetical protein
MHGHMQCIYSYIRVRVAFIRPVLFLPSSVWTCIECPLRRLISVQNILSADTVVYPGKLKVIHSVVT